MTAGAARNVPAGFHSRGGLAVCAVCVCVCVSRDVANDLYM
jgi:hypothetical protein